ncbi:putative protein-export membrane protein SecD [Dictyocaulus viviparus]|uniref:SecDF P1 head subdomain domain-containing protein n=1 Tax=Dictyocaulus viviparus TaxID=29172 RepID=A0A0D8XFV9_DICVI|nr:putative protein-export membrane protein SecD [Dictyocaulus viviparus]
MQDVDHETTVMFKDSLGNSYPVFCKTEIGGDSLVNTSFRFGSLGKPTIHFKFDSIAILTVPIIREPILNGEGEISGNFVEKQASELAILLKSGALPAPLKIIEERNIGPSLGEESIKAGKIAAMISIVAATLTLPEIAGIVLTLGMSVDANILIFESIREEIKSGKRTVRAIEEGFENAIKTIRDSNLTTLIAEGIMFTIGGGAIRGFSVVLSVGILCSMFSAIIVTKLLTELYVDAKNNIFVGLLKLISLPLVFLSIISTISLLKDLIEIKTLLERTLFYTLLTTIIAAFVALFFYLFMDPVRRSFISSTIESELQLATLECQWDAILWQLVSMGVPLHVMGLILPIYTIIDICEIAINVWSDVCITQIISKECKNET